MNALFIVTRLTSGKYRELVANFIAREYGVERATELQQRLRLRYVRVDKAFIAVQIPAGSIQKFFGIEFLTVL